jgi:hypothetical protein
MYYSVFQHIRTLHIGSRVARNRGRYDDGDQEHLPAWWVRRLEKKGSRQDQASFDHGDNKSPAPASIYSSRTAAAASLDLCAPSIPWLKTEREAIPELQPRRVPASDRAGYQRAAAAPSLWALCSVLNHLAGLAQLRRWAIDDATCAAAVMDGPKDQGRHGMLYKLSDGSGPALALKVFKAGPQPADSGGDGEGSSDRLPVPLSLQVAPPSLLELFHLLRCRDIEQVMDGITNIKVPAANAQWP